MNKKGTAHSQKSFLAQLAKKLKLSVPKIAKLCGLSESNLKKVASSKRPLSRKVALVLASRFGFNMECLLNKNKKLELLNTDGEEWHHFDAPPAGTASDYDFMDERKAYILAVEDCAKEAGYSLPDDKEKRLRIAKAVECFNPHWTNHDIGNLKPHKVEPARYALAFFRKWNERNAKLKRSEEATLHGYLESRKNEYLRTARRTARKDIMQFLEELLVDASYHPESPLIANAVIKSLLDIKNQFRVHRQGTRPTKKGKIVSTEIETTVNGMNFCLREYEAAK